MLWCCAFQCNWKQVNAKIMFIKSKTVKKHRKNCEGQLPSWSDICLYRFFLKMKRSMSCIWCCISFHLSISFNLRTFYDLHHCSDTGGCCLMWMGRSSADKFFAAAGELTRLTLYLYCVTLLYFPMYLYCICVDPAGPVLESESISFLSSFFESSLHPVYSRPL